MIYTASFKLLNKLNGYCQLAISCGVPKWYTGGRYKKLAPPHFMVMIQKEATQGELSEADIQLLSNTYCNEVLMNLDPHEVYSELQEISGGNPVVLLSQETSDEFSIRIILSAWFNQAGIPCEELR
jgi:hypothetical protein